MERLRWIFSSLTVISLLLLIATVALWLRGYHVTDEFIWNRQTVPDAHFGSIDHFQRLASSHGRFIYENAAIPALYPPNGWKSVSADGYVGFGTGLSVPAVYLAIIAGFLPLVWTFREITRRAQKVGGCPVCGYDLRATPDRCPECGTIPLKKQLARK
jgi:hypothetical protein